MKQKTNILVKVSPRLSIALKYTVAATATVCLVAAILFSTDFFGNNKDATANNLNSNTIFLTPADSLYNIREAQPAINISSTNDSLYIEFVSDDEEPIQNAVLRLKDTKGNGTEKSVQTRVMTLFSPTMVNQNSYRFALPIKGFPDNICVEVKATVSQKATPLITKAWTAQLDYNLKGSAITMVHSGMQKAKRK